MFETTTVGRFSDLGHSIDLGLVPDLPTLKNRLKHIYIYLFLRCHGPATPMVFTAASRDDAGAALSGAEWF